MLRYEYPNFFDKHYDYWNNFVTALSGETSDLHKIIQSERTYKLWTELRTDRYDVNIMNKNFETPILAATRIENKKNALEMIKYLLKSDADVNIGDYEGNTPLHTIVQNEPDFDTLEILEVFLKHPKTKINIKNQLGESPLHVVKSEIMTEKLIFNGAQVNILDNSRNTPLHKQVTRPEIIKILIKNGGEVNLKNVNELTPLHEAITRKCDETVVILLENGADVNLTITQKYTTVEMAYEFKSSPIIKKKLLEKSDSIYMIYAAAYDDSILEEVLEKWSKVCTNEDKIVKFIFRLINMLKFRKDIKRVSCVRLISQFFLQNISLLGSNNCVRIFKKFSQFLGRSLLNYLLKTHNYFNIDESFREIENLFTVFLNHGEKLDYSDLEVIYFQFGDSTLLHRLVKFGPEAKTRKLKQIPLFPKILCDPTINLTQLLKTKTVSTIELQEFFDMHNIARYCTLPKNLWKNFSQAYVNIYEKITPPVFKTGMEECLREIRKNCGVPSLVEISRNAARSALCQQFDINKSRDLYGILEKLQIPSAVIGILMMEYPLHLNVKLPNYCPYTKHAYLL